MSSRPLIRDNAHPALRRFAALRQQDLQSRLADRITQLAGSMVFVYVHVVWFGLWIGLGAERYPFGLLTMIVSLEAIFLSTFVMISQNRADERRKILADQEWQFVQTEEKQNEELLALSKQILDLTTSIHRLTTERPPTSDAGPRPEPIA